jgi:D-xylose transport system substrate-binding protein
MYQTLFSVRLTYPYKKGIVIMKIKNLCLTLRQLPPARQHGGMAKEVKIGMAIDDLRLERWQKDRDIFVNKAESLGAKVFVQSANGNEETQMSQIENMINRGVDVLVIIPYNGQVLSNVIKEAKQEGIKVLAYDRMINNAILISIFLSTMKKSVKCRRKAWSTKCRRVIIS